MMCENYRFRTYVDRIEPTDDVGDRPSALSELAQSRIRGRGGGSLQGRDGCVEQSTMLHNVHGLDSEIRRSRGVEDEYAPKHKHR